VEPETEVVVTPPPAPAPTPSPTPSPEAETADGDDGEDKVASVDLTALDSAGILRRDNGLSILFTRDSQDLPASAEPALTELAARMNDNEDLTLTLLGYSEAIGDSGSKPRRLSLFRALAVRTFLAEGGNRQPTDECPGPRHQGRQPGSSAQPGRPHRKRRLTIEPPS
jgi:outer membrane protein OmpA-like peptidoglycan-associated protein